MCTVNHNIICVCVFLQAWYPCSNSSSSNSRASPWFLSCSRTCKAWWEWTMGGRCPQGPCQCRWDLRWLCCIYVSLWFFVCPFVCVFRWNCPFLSFFSFVVFVWASINECMILKQYYIDLTDFIQVEAWDLLTILAFQSIFSQTVLNISTLTGIYRSLVIFKSINIILNCFTVPWYEHLISSEKEYDSRNANEVSKLLFVCCLCLTGWHGYRDADPWDAVLGSATVYGYETSWTPVHCWHAETNGRGAPVRHHGSSLCLFVWRLCVSSNAHIIICTFYPAE